MKNLVVLIIAILLAITAVADVNAGPATFEWEGGISQSWGLNYESDFPGSTPAPAQRLRVRMVIVAVCMLGAFAGCLILETKRHQGDLNNGQ